MNRDLKGPRGMIEAYATCPDELRRRGLLPATHLAVYVAGSQVRGWGNTGSDLDLYVIYGDGWPTPTMSAAPVALRPDTIGVEAIHVKGRRWDVEYWLDNQVDQMLRKVSWQEFDTSPAAGNLLTSREVDFLERLRYAVPISGEDWLARRRKQLHDSALQSVLVARGLHLTALFVEDAIGQLRADDTESSVLSAKLAYGCAIKALLAAHGQLDRSSKWTARQFREAKQDVLSFEDYWAVETMRTYDPADPAQWVEEVVVTCRKISFEVGV